MAETARLQDQMTPPPPAKPAGKARKVLIRRLTDVVCLPSTRANGFERSMAADLLLEMVREASGDERRRVAQRLANLSDIPNPLLRLLLRDVAEVARPLLEEGTAVCDADLIGCARDAGPEHRRLIALRRNVSEAVADVLIDKNEPAVVETLLRNADAKVSQVGVEALIAVSRRHPTYPPLLLKRGELKPNQAFVLFWWADPECRMQVLSRFALGRDILQDMSGDVFPLAAAEGWQDPLVRKALQFIERRQRNRAAVERSPYDSLEDAVGAAQHGMTRELVGEIAYLSGLKPTTAAKILSDARGEPIAILCKATGLPKSAIRALWRGMRRPEVDAQGQALAALERSFVVYDMMAVAGAQTVLRYWNWALSAALTPVLVRAVREGDEAEDDDLSPTPLALAPDFAG